MRALLSLLAALPLAAAEALPRIPLFSAGTPLPAVNVVGSGWRDYAPVIQAWLKQRYPAIPADDPGALALAEMLARWTHEKDGVVAVSEKYGDLFLAGFARYAAVADAVAASALPPEVRKAWLIFAADRLIRARLAIDPAPWATLIAAIPAGGVLATGDPIAAIPGFAALTPARRRAAVHALARINPGLVPDGWHRAAAAPAAIPGLVQFATPEGTGVLIERWRLEGACYVPPAAWFASQPEAPAVVDGLADTPALRVVRLELPTGYAGRVPLHLQCAFRADGTLDNAVATAPTLANRAWAAYPAEPPLRLGEGGLTGGVRVAIKALTKTRTGRHDLVLALDTDAAFTGTASIAFDGKPPAANTPVRAAPAPAAIGIPATATWRQWFGDGMDGRGTGAGLVADLEDATLAWAAVDDLPTGRGLDTRGKVKAVPPGEPLSGTYATPVVAHGLAFITSFEPSGAALAYGATDPDLHRANRILADDLVIAVSLADGAPRWQRRFPGGVNWAGFNKGGPKLSAAVAGDVVIAIGTTGVVRGIDAATGAQRWENDLGYRARQLRCERDRLVEAGEMLSTRNDFMIDPVVIDGVVITGDAARTKIDYRYEFANGIVAFDAATGRRLWTLPELGPGNRFNGGVQAVRLGGRMFALVPAGDGLRLVEPATGTVRWHTPHAQLHQQGIALSGDILLAEDPAPAEAPKGWAPGLVALKITPEAATVAWRADAKLKRMAGNPLARDGRFWVGVELPQRQIVALSAAGGAIQLELPLAIAGGEHCPFLVDAGDRLIAPADRTDGYWWIAPDPARPDARFWSGESAAAPLATGYCASILPAIVDGRMLVRAYGRLLCYDLRQAAASARADAAAWPKPAPAAPAKGGDKDD